MILPYRESASLIVTEVDAVASVEGLAGAPREGVEVATWEGGGAAWVACPPHAPASIRRIVHPRAALTDVVARRTEFTCPCSLFTVTRSLQSHRHGVEGHV